MSTHIIDRLKLRWEQAVEWRKSTVPDKVCLIISAIVTGLVTGSLAYLLKHTVKWVSVPLTSHLHPTGGNWLLLVLPLAGILLAVAYQRYVIHQEIYHGVDRLRRNLETGSYVLPAHLMVSPIIASTLTLGFGGSAGSEGPIAYTGAAVGSNIARLMGMRPELMRTMLACGAGAGIAGIFKAPMGGALFAFEVLAISLDCYSVIAVFTAAITAGLTSFVWGGCVPDVWFPLAETMSWSQLDSIALIGVACGIYSAYYAVIMKKMTDHYARMKNHWAKNVMSGLIVGVLVFLFPTLYGEGYGSVAKLLADNSKSITDYGLFNADHSSVMVLMVVAAGLMIAKPLATSSTNSGGGVAGDFAPTLMIGSVTGFLFATVANSCLGCGLPVADFVFLGMAGVMSGAIGAPLMAIFLTVEMGDCYQLLLPTTIVSMISYSTAWLLSSSNRLWRRI